MVFANLAQATSEDRAAVTNQTTENSTLYKQVALYTNRLSTKEVEKMALQTSMRNLQGELKNLKAEVASLKKSGHSVGASAAKKDNGRLVPKWKIEGQSHHLTWWSTTYRWSHGAGIRPGAECKNKRPVQKTEAIATERLGGRTFGIPQGL